MPKDKLGEGVLSVPEACRRLATASEELARAYESARPLPQVQAIGTAKPAGEGEAASDKILLTTKEACERLGVSERTLFRLRQSGGLPFKKIGERVLYPVDRLKEWANETTPRDAQAAPG